jgi:hypothetical protein
MAAAQGFLAIQEEHQEAPKSQHTPSLGERFINGSGAWRGEVVKLCLGFEMSTLVMPGQKREARLRAR